MFSIEFENKLEEIVESETHLKEWIVTCDYDCVYVDAISDVHDDYLTYNRFKIKSIIEKFFKENLRSESICDTFLVPNEVDGHLIYKLMLSGY